MSHCSSQHSCRDIDDKYEELYENNNNIITHKRNNGNPTSRTETLENDDYQRRRQLELLKTSTSWQRYCKDFGAFCEQKYSGYFFCKQFKDWDDIPRENKCAKRTHAMYKCTAGHDIFLNPTVLIKIG